MSASSQTKTSDGTALPSHGAIACGACGNPNPSGGHFCAGCGHALVEDCGECGKQVRLTHSFCGSCGCDLAESLRKHRSALERYIADAVQAAKDRNFERSKSLLGLILREKDFRYADLAKNANAALKKVEAIAIQEEDVASKSIAAAEEADQADDCLKVIKLLGSVPSNLLSEKAREMLDRSQALVDQTQTSVTALEEALSRRDWEVAGPLLDQLLQLQPDNETYKSLSSKIGKKLLKKAGANYQDLRYTHCLELLGSVPEGSRGIEFDRLIAATRRMVWYSRQFSGEPFATATLGRLAKRWLHDSKDDSNAKAMLKRLSDKIKQPRASERDLFPQFTSTSRSWLGGDLGVLGFPKCVVGLEQTDYRKSAGLFNTALGLALQGLGVAPIKDDFLPRKKGILDRLRRKKDEGCLGIDLGAQGLKAVFLQKAEDGNPKLVDSYHDAFDSSVSRSIDASRSDELIREAIKRFLKWFAEKGEIADVSVWVNFPGRELVSRFVQLPPLADKQANQLFSQEVKDRLPIPLDEVVDVRWMAALPGEAQHPRGRPAFVSAAKLSFVEGYLMNLELAGLKVDGLQATPIALANFAAVEFADEVQVSDELSEDEVGSTVRAHPAIGLVDCGAEATTIMLVAESAFWFWSIESGGEEFTRLLARAAKTSHLEAENLKRNPATLSEPNLHYEQVEQRMDELSGRIKKIVADAKSGEPAFDVKQSWASGGGVRAHGWIKRVIASSDNQ